jgi:hypothetical protein
VTGFPVHTVEWTVDAVTQAARRSPVPHAMAFAGLGAVEMLRRHPTHAANSFRDIATSRLLSFRLFAVLERFCADTHPTDALRALVASVGTTFTF